MCFCAVRRECLASHNCGKVRLPQTFRPTKRFRLCKHRQVIVSPQLLTILMLEIARDYCCWCRCFVNTAMASNTTPSSLIVVGWKSLLFLWWNSGHVWFAQKKKKTSPQVLIILMLETSPDPNTTLRRIRVAILSWNVLQKVFLMTPWQPQ